MSPNGTDISNNTPINSPAPPLNPNNSNPPFDPMADIDISHIEDQIIDTSQGGKIDFTNMPYSHVYSFRCLNCDFKYEGHELLEKCPRCGSNKLDDSQ